ncbi:MAG: hypothetical protein ACPGJV_04710 [Bacteriovoracaceae bacterium]
MKLFTAVLLALFSHSLFASQLSGKDISAAFDAALVEASVSIDKDSIIAWQSEVDDHEVEVKILNEHDVKLTYGCHQHLPNPAMVCHEEFVGQGNNHQHKDADITFDFVQKGHTAAVTKFEKTMKRRGKDLSILSAVKVWIHEDDHGGGHGHDHGPDVWTKLNYELDGTASAIFVICHVHGHDDHFSCHYSNTGEEEPTLDF